MKKNATDQQIIAEMTAAREQADEAHKKAIETLRADTARQVTLAREQAKKFQAQALDGAVVAKLQAQVERQAGVIDLLNEQITTLQDRVRFLEEHALDEARAALAARILGRIVAFMGEG